jgi:ribonucleoside-diphosphate reductase beta chain
MENSPVSNNDGLIILDRYQPMLSRLENDQSALLKPPVLVPIKAKDKRVVNGKADINQLAPFKYEWAWKFFLDANKNHWLPTEVDMGGDVNDYRNRLTDDERHVYDSVLSYLTTSDILAMRNIGLAVMEKMSAPELQIYQARQVYEEALHTWTYQNCIETLGLDQGEVYNRYRTIPEIHRKVKMTQDWLDAILRSNIDLTNRDELRRFAMSYLFFAAVFEGCWFYNGFSPVFSMQRRGLMKGTGEQFQYIMRDESMHAAFGLQVIKTLLEEESLELDPNEVGDMWLEAEAAETSYARHLLRNPIMGYNSADHVEQFRFLANVRSRSVGLRDPFPGARNALPWLDEQANVRKEKNFFESRVSEYQSGSGLSWE